ncbi:MAG: DUF2726 domain-containing protein [Arenicellales bacterium]
MLDFPLKAAFTKARLDSDLNFFALLLPVLLVGGLYAGLAVLKRRFFNAEKSEGRAAPPDPALLLAAVQKSPVAANSPPVPDRRSSGREAGDEELSLAPARLYPRRTLSDVQMRVFSTLLKALPGYVVLPKITYDHFLEARDGSPSENTSLQNRAARHLADFLVCDKKLHVLLVCEIDDGTQVPARIQEREKMLQKSGLRLLRWNLDQAPEPAAVLRTVQTLEKARAEARAPGGRTQQA